MEKYTYMIIGSGMTADAAVRGIRELDTKGSIGILSAETDLPYSRPPLSKGLWKGQNVDEIWRKTEELNVGFHLGRKAITLDTFAKRIRDDHESEYAYDTLLLATGGTPIHLPFGGDQIIYYRTLEDYHHLRALTEQGKRILVIGAGFIGSEVAAALNMLGREVVMVFLENSIGERIYPPNLSRFLNDLYREKGVELFSADGVESFTSNGSSVEVRTKNGRIISADAVVAGLGIRPDTALAESAGLRIDNGIVVDEYQRTSAADVYAAGDVANFPHAVLGKRKRVEHEDHALHMGRQAGRNMAGANEPYNHTPVFYSDIFEYGYEAIGELNSKMEIVEDWAEPYKTGVVYYLDNSRVQGVLLWNVWDKLPLAEALIAEPGPFTGQNVIGRIKPE